MLALVNGPPPRVVRDHPRPERGPGEARIRVRLAGVCDTDLQLAAGYMGFRGVLGHELVGEVVESAGALGVGTRVVADISAGCGACDDCRARGGHHCATRTVLGILGRDGALAEELVMPERCLVPVPDALPDERAVFAEPLAAALHVLDALDALDTPDSAGRGRGAPVVVLGDGKLGLLVVHALRSAGLAVFLVGHHEDKLALGRALGATSVLEHALGPHPERARAVVEATGSPGGLALALRLLEPRGTLVLKTTTAGPASADLAPIVVHELRIVGSRCGDIGRAVAALATGAVDPSALVAARYPLARADEALAHAARRGVLKVLVEP
ncbi:MAG: alcohol dehydrogenase catalytic domain-containing protein [Polyangiaceae bacterium]|nr:alcohol dehydrogenase catalytic domain-containing protein [Polyangiaceae bacterium]